MRQSSWTPEATSAAASATAAAQGLERKRPRQDGIAQKVHAWLQPSATRRYAVCAGVSRCRAASGRKGTVASPTCGHDTPCEEPTVLSCCSAQTQGRNDTRCSSTPAGQAGARGGCLSSLLRRCAPCRRRRGWAARSHQHPLPLWPLRGHAVRRRERLSDRRRQLAVALEANDEVRLRNGLRQVRAVALRHTTGDDHSSHTAAAVCLQLRRIQDGLPAQGGALTTRVRPQPPPCQAPVSVDSAAQCRDCPQPTERRWVWNFTGRGVAAARATLAAARANTPPATQPSPRQ